MIEKTELYESRAEVVSVEFTQGEDGNLTPKILIGPKDPEEIEMEELEE